MRNDITQVRLVPVVVVNDAAQASGLGDAMVAGGLPVAEVTFRTDAAEAVIRTLAARGDMLVGAGTVVTPEQVDIAAQAGASFIVSPGLSEVVVRRAQERGLDVLPGCVTPSEIMAAMALGLDAVKFFPAGNYGGAKTLKSLSGPFGAMTFLPTGGISETNMGEYLALPNVPAVGGSWMVPVDAVDAGDFARIETLCRDAVAAAAAL